MDLTVVIKLKIKEMQMEEHQNVIFVTKLYEKTLSELCVNTADS